MTIPPTIPLDPGIPGAQGLIGPAGIDAVTGFLADRGWQAGEVRPVQALYRPGRSLVIRYRTVARDTAGTKHSMWICAESRQRRRDPGSVPDRAPLHGLPDPIERRGDYLVWAFPCDPGLPDNELVTGNGDAIVSHLDGVIHHRTEPVRYRPRRRTVFKTRALRRTSAGNAWTEVYVKVMPPARVTEAMQTAEALRPHADRFDLVFPRHRPGAGTMVFDAHPGANLRQLLVDDAASLPHPRRVAEFLTGLAALPVDRTQLPLAADPVHTAERAQELLTLLIPDLSDSLQTVCEAVGKGAADAGSRQGVIHGDLYEGQLLVDGDFGLTVIDTDGMCWGDPADDAANFLAHLVALADSYPDQRQRLLAYREVARREFQAALGCDERDLVWRECLAMVWLATGPFRVLSRNWPAEVERRVRVAARMLENDG